MLVDLMAGVIVVMVLAAAGAVYNRSCKGISDGFLSVPRTIMDRRKGGSGELEDEDIGEFEADHWITYEKLIKSTVTAEKGGKRR